MSVTIVTFVIGEAIGRKLGLQDVLFGQYPFPRPGFTNSIPKPVTYEKADIAPE
jgi:GMP synthase PP-ATPase subunit